MLLLFIGGFGAFRDRYPEWCEGCQTSNECAPGQDNNDGELMGLRSLRISTPPTRSYSDSDSDSTCDSVGEQYSIYFYYIEKYIFMIINTIIYNTKT